MSFKKRCKVCRTELGEFEGHIVPADSVDASVARVPYFDRSTGEFYLVPLNRPASGFYSYCAKCYREFTLMRVA